MQARKSVLLTMLAVLPLLACSSQTIEPGKSTNTTIVPVKKRVLWFIPDGLRAEPDTFTIYKWAQDGHLPNLKKMIEAGAYGYSVPVFPSHTPVNYATLFTGTSPLKHGVADGPMRTEGQPLSKISVAGFSSVARRLPSIWNALEDRGYDVVLLSVPGSTPPDLKVGTVYRGRWGGWGADFHSTICESANEKHNKSVRGVSTRLFYLGPELTQFLKSEPGQPAVCQFWGQKILIETHHAGKNRVNFRIAGTEKDVALFQGEWSDWQPIQLKWNSISIDTLARFHVIKTDKNGFFRVRIQVANLNKYNTSPPEEFADLHQHTGPMVDFVDNFPPQLNFYPEDKITFLDEMNQSFNWHESATSRILNHHKPNLFIHSIYNPNQMLSAKFWMGAVDPQSQHFKKTPEPSRKQLWSEVLDMYKRVDAVLGLYLQAQDASTYVVFSSDHGIAAYNRTVLVNHIFAKEGLLKYEIDPLTSEPKINWKKTKAAFIIMDNVFVNPNGLDGNYKRARGEEYERLRDRVKKILESVKDRDGQSPFVRIVKREHAPTELELPQDRIGDLVLSIAEGYGLTEEIKPSEKKSIIASETQGNKQAIDPGKTRSLWTPFVISGPGIRPGFQITQPIRHADQMPTILRALGEEIPPSVEGRALEEIFKSR